MVPPQALAESPCSCPCSPSTHRLQLGGVPLQVLGHVHHLVDDPIQLLSTEREQCPVLGMAPGVSRVSSPKLPRSTFPHAQGYPSPHLYRRGSNTPVLNGCSFFLQGFLP